ncbi:MAG TPA: guanylate kinase [Candidatus Polarisedimenticolaceae bacterium]|nr:guanylate kinase [Candidatus Polarisedimenticolaceae bacterium]
MSERRQGILFVIAAPSGTGKSSVAREVLARDAELEFSISYTTRAPRDGERDGREYHFIDRDEFARMRERQAFLESAEVFDQLYGTGLEATRRSLATGKDLLLDIDVQGARQVTGGPLEAVTIMIFPPDYRTLTERLERRGSEDRAQSRRRLAKARAEAEDYLSFDYLVVNRDLEAAVRDVSAIVHGERRRTRRCATEARRVLATFPVEGSTTE